MPTRAAASRCRAPPWSASSTRARRPAASVRRAMRVRRRSSSPVSRPPACGDSSASAAMARSNLESGCAVRPKSSCSAAAMVARSASVPSPLSSASTSYCGGRAASPATIVRVSSESSATVRPPFVRARSTRVCRTSTSARSGWSPATASTSLARLAGRPARRRGGRRGGRQIDLPLGAPVDGGAHGAVAARLAAGRLAAAARLAAGRLAAAPFDGDDHAVATVAPAADHAGASAARDRLSRGRRRT